MFDTILTYSKCFLGYPSLGSTSIRGAKYADIGDPWVKDSCIRDIYIRSACTEITYIWIAGAKSIDARGTYIRGAYIGIFNIEHVFVRGVGIIEYLEIDLQFSQSLEVKQYNIRLEIQIRASWWLLYLLQILYKPTSNTFNNFLNNISISATNISWLRYISWFDVGCCYLYVGLNWFLYIYWGPCISWYPYIG